MIENLKNNKKKGPSKKNFKAPNLSATLDEFEDFIICKLTGFIGKSRSEVGRNIVKEWINDNSERIKKMLNVDLNELRRQFNASELENELNNFEKIAIEKLPEMFKTIKRISIRKLADQLNLTQHSLEKIFFFHIDKINAKNFSIKYDDGYIIVN